MSQHQDRIPHSSPAAEKRVRISRNVWILTISSFLTDVSSEIVLNVLPLFLVNVLGVGVAAVGLIEAIAESTSSLT